MKKLIGFLMAVLLALSLPLVVAEENGTEEKENREKDEAGITPDSLFYGLDRALERINLALTFNKAAKTEKGLKIARERLIEAKKMAEEGKIEETEKAQRGYEEIINKTQRTIEGLESDSKAEKIRESMRIMAELQNRTESHYEQVSEIKDFILERQREIMNEEQINQLQAIFEKIKEKANEMEGKTELKRDHIRFKYMALLNKTEEEVTEEETEIEKDIGLVKARKERAEREILRAEKAVGEAIKKMKEKEAEGINLTEIKAQLNNTKEQLKETEKLKETKSKEAQKIAEEIKDFGKEISSLAISFEAAKKEGELEKGLTEMKERIREMHQMRLEHLEVVLEKVSEETKHDIEKVIEVQEEKIITEKIKKEKTQSEKEKEDEEGKEEGPVLNNKKINQEQTTGITLGEDEEKDAKSNNN